MVNLDIELNDFTFEMVTECPNTPIDLLAHLPAENTKAVFGCPDNVIAAGRFFASIVLHEGPEMIKMVSDFLGDQVLMFSTDYPHPETRFPDSVDLVLGWSQLNSELLPQIMWNNAVRCFGEP